MSDNNGNISFGSHYCHCCCGRDTIHTNNECSDGYMRCVSCTCSTRVPDGSTPPANIQIRLVHIGGQTLHSMRTLTTLAELLGATDNSRYVRVSNSETYIEISTEGIQSRLEVESYRKVLQGAV